jgi:putative holliday junction resolvase
VRSLGLDIGDRRIGLAVSDPLGILARPLTVIERREETLDIAAILEIAAQNQVAIIIAGLPQSMDGSLGQQARKVMAFTDKLRQASPVPVEYRDESLTTVEAKHLMEEGRAKKGPQYRRVNYDAAAAAVILQSYLNESHPMEFPPD